MCDDDSLDLAGEVVEGLGADVVRHKRSLGYGAVLRSLFGRARKLGLMFWRPWTGMGSTTQMRSQVSENQQ